MDDAASRFWDKYILKTTSYNVPEGARHWYVRHAEAFIKAQSGRRLATLTANDIERYLKMKCRNEKLADWQFRQLVDALRILFTGVVSSAWANSFDWAGWKAGARELPADHATIARRTLSADQATTLSEKTYLFWVARFVLNGRFTRRMKCRLTGLHLILNTSLSIVMLRPIHRVSRSIPSFFSTDIS